MNDSPKSIGARWIILPGSGPPLRDTALVVANGIIRDLVPGGRSTADMDYGDVALLPRLVNAHTHLEFSHLKTPLGHPGMPITDWIPQVIRARNASTGDSLPQRIQQGILECMATGTGAIGEIAASPWNQQCQPQVDCQITCFFERLGTSSADASGRLTELNAWLEEFDANAWNPPWRESGISPHAPYSLHDELFEQLVQCAIDRRLPMAMHVAESREEMEWLERGTGPFGDMLESLGVPIQRPSGRRPLHYLKRLATAPRSLVIHGNYLQTDELDFIAGQRERMHLVICPRTHEFFRHDQWPLEAALSRDINVAIGTDSRASNPDLNLWSELRAVARLFPGIPAERILQMGTTGGARALGLEHQSSSLSVGGKAAWWMLDVDESVDQPLEWLLRGPAS